MNSRELKLLEKAFEAEVDAAFTGSEFHFMQTKSKLAERLVTDGLLQKVERKSRFGPMVSTFSGYELTELGRLTYCTSTNERGKA